MFVQATGLRARNIRHSAIYNELAVQGGIDQNWDYELFLTDKSAFTSLYKNLGLRWEMRAADWRAVQDLRVLMVACPCDDHGDLITDERLSQVLREDDFTAERLIFLLHLVQLIGRVKCMHRVLNLLEGSYVTVYRKLTSIGFNIPLSPVSLKILRLVTKQGESTMSMDMARLARFLGD